VIDLIEQFGREGNRAGDDDTAMIAALEGLQAPAEDRAAADLLELMAQAGVEIASPAENASTSASERDPVPVREAGASLTLPRSRTEMEAGRDAETTVRVDVQVLDRMVHLVGELVLTRNQILNKRTDDVGASQAAERLDSLTQELRQTVMQARMLPLAQLFQRFPRMVRDLAKVCSKSVRIEFAGQETALDRSLIEAIKDPLTHTLRNAVDHGIEPECERFTAGKPLQGVIRLSARQQSGWVIIEVRDDGAGISKDRLIERAIERGSLSVEQAAAMTDREVMDLVFEAGFSTAAQVTHISGRGVGMDVVRSQVERVGGSVEVESQDGIGTVVRLRVPLTLAIVPAWIVRAGDHNFCIPQLALAELACVQHREAEHLCGRVHEAEVYRLRDELLPMVSLDDVLGLKKQRGPLGFYVAVVEVDEVRFALVVDDVIAAEEIVVKPVSSVVRQLGVYSGATVLGDGDVAMVLDMAAIANRAGMRNEGRRTRVEVKDAVASAPMMLLAEIEAPGGPNQRVAFGIESIERIETIDAGSLETIGGRLMMPYRGQVLCVQDAAGLSRGTSRGQELTLLICLDADENRCGVLVSRVLEVSSAPSAQPKEADVGAKITLLKDRLTLMLGSDHGRVPAVAARRSVA
jgi:two-component system chemotaxis sensor kinase CheA